MNTATIMKQIKPPPRKYRVFVCMFPRLLAGGGGGGFTVDGGVGVGVGSGLGDGSGEGEGLGDGVGSGSSTVMFTANCTLL
jgi:hypothetical protein